MKVVMLAAASSEHTLKWLRQLETAGVDVSLITSAPLRGGEMEQIVVGRQSYGRWRYIISSRRVRRLIESLKPDIVHACYATSYGYWGARSRFHPLVISVWGSDITLTPRDSAIARWLTGYSLGRADAICATSRYLADTTIKLYPSIADKLTVVPFGVDTALYALHEGRRFDNDDIVVGSVRYLVHVYGIDLLLEAFSHVLKKIPGARLKLAGDGPERNNLEMLADRLAVRDRVEFLGHVDPSDMPAFLNSIDIAVLPSREEGYGVSAIEAMSCGVPVIASRTGGLIDVLDDGRAGILVEPGSPEVLAEAIVNLASDSEKRAELSMAGRNRATGSYDLTIATEKQMSVYRQILSL
jgi:glycosyltransferase involved in cell wall biosynthesis